MRLTPRTFYDDIKKAVKGNDHFCLGNLNVDQAWSQKDILAFDQRTYLFKEIYLCKTRINSRCLPVQAWQG
jgi:hypothetical protein